MGVENFRTLDTHFNAESMRIHEEAINTRKRSSLHPHNLSSRLTVAGMFDPGPHYRQAKI